MRASVVRICAGALAGLSMAGCDPAQPTESEGRAALERMMRSHFPKAPMMTVTSFQKTNGVTMKASGVALYQMHYSARIEFPQGFMPKKGDFWGEFMGGADMMGTVMMLGTQGFRVAKGGQVTDPQILEVNSAMTFQMTERGWVVTQ
jgi:hypothetical protein